MHAPVRGSLFVALLACLFAPTFIASADYVPTPIVEVGKPRLEAIAYSPDGRLLATLTTDWIELLDADTFEPVARFGRGGDEIGFSSDGSEIAVFGGAEPARIYNAVTGTLKEELPATRWAHAFSPDWRRLAYSEGDTVYVWDRDAQAVTATLTGDPEPDLLSVTTVYSMLNSSGQRTSNESAQRVRHLAFLPDGIGLLVVSYRRTVALWNSLSGELVRQYDFGNTWVNGIAVRPGGVEFAVRTHHSATLVWQFDDPEPRPVAEDPALEATSLLGYDPAAGRLWLGGDASLHRLDTDDGAISTGRAPTPPSASALYPPSVTFDAHRGRAATVLGERMAIWSVEPMRLDRLVDHAWGAGTGNAGAVYVPGRRRVVTFGRTTRRWDHTAGDVFQTQDLPAHFYVAASTDDGSITALHVLDELRVYRTSTGRQLASIDLRRAYGLAISRTGRYVAAWDGVHTAVWSVAGGRRLATLATGPSASGGLAFTPSERRLVVRTVQLDTLDDTLQVWDIAEEELMMTVPGGGPFAATPNGIMHVVWRPEESADRHFEVRRVGADAPLSVIPPLWDPSRSFVYAFVRLDPAGRYVALRDRDPTTEERAIRFFSATSGELLATRLGTSDIQFTAGGDYLFTKGPNDGLALYRTEEYLNIPSDELTPRNKALTAWGHVKRSQLLPNYPNPFNPETWIPFDLAASGPVHIAIYDASGAVVRRVDLGHVETGVHRTRERAARWDGRDAGGEPVASGVYTYRVTAPGLSDSGRMLLIK